MSRQLGLLDIDDLDDRVLEFLSAAAAELAHAAGIPRRQSSDDPPVVLVRLVAKVAIRHPTASGPHTAKLFEQLP